MSYKKSTGIKLPATCLMLVCPVFSPLFAEEYDITSNSPHAWQFVGDTVANIKTDLVYENIYGSSLRQTRAPLASVFHSSGSLALTAENEGERYSLVFSNNNCSSVDSLVFSTGDLSFDFLDRVVFSGNSACFNASESLYHGMGAWSEKGTVSFNNTNSVVFRDNHIDSSHASLVSSKDEGCNSSREFGVSFNQVGEITFDNNNGRAITSMSGVLISGVENVLFKDNIGVQEGAAIYSQSSAGDGKSISIIQCGDVLFEGNKANERGGAIKVELAGKDNREMSVFLSADQGDIVFKGNVHQNGTESGNPVANSIYIHGDSDYNSSQYGRLDFRAQRGKEIVFYDPIVTAQMTQGSNKQMGMMTVMDFNKPEEGANSDFQGTVRFSGKETAQYICKDQNGTETDSQYQARLEESRYNSVIAHTTLHNGTMVVEQGAVYGYKDIYELKTRNLYSSFNLSKGVLDINTGGVINAYSISFSGSDAVIRADNTAVINAYEADLSRGMCFDLQYYFENDSLDSMSGTDGLTINADKFTLGGMITIDDCAPGFYDDKRWAEDRVFTLLVLNKKSTPFGSFDGIQSLSFGSDVVESFIGYQGVWDLLETGTKDQRFVTATWTVTGYSIPEPCSAIFLVSAFVFSSFYRRKL